VSVNETRNTINEAYIDIEAQFASLGRLVRQANYHGDYAIGEQVKAVRASVMESLDRMEQACEQDYCTCHERDMSYVCDYCYAKGFRGHMQK